jgi:hypothetical protein
MKICDDFIKAVKKISRYDASPLKGKARHICFFPLLPDRQRQLFQPFHLWQTLPGFPFVAFTRSSQKAAS